MLFDPEIRRAKYLPVREAILRDGFHAEVMLGEAEPDALGVWSVSAVTNVAKTQSRFWLYCRQRGWFLGVSGPRHYLIPNSDAVLSVAHTLAAATRGGDGEEALARVVQELMLPPVEQATWHRDESEEKRLAWEKYGWYLLSQDKEAKLWEQFSSHLLNPAGELHPPTPALTWGIPNFSGEQMDEPCKTEGLLTLAVLDALRRCTSEEQDVLALDWDHPCYRFLPHQGMRKPFRDYWAIPFWPRADSYYFVAPSFEYGLLASRAGKIHVFGQALLDASNAALTALLGSPKA